MRFIILDVHGFQGDNKKQSPILQSKKWAMEVEAANPEQAARAATAHQGNITVEEQIPNCWQVQGENLAVFAIQMGTIAEPETSSITDRDINIYNLKFNPGGKWGGSKLSFEAATPIGRILYRETIPGPRGGNEDLGITIDGIELDTEHFGDTGYEYLPDAGPDFGIPNGEGRGAERFRAAMASEIPTIFASWLTANAGKLANPRLYGRRPS